MDVLSDILLKAILISDLIFIEYFVALFCFHNVLKLTFSFPMLFSNNREIMLFWGWIVTPLGLILGLQAALFSLISTIKLIIYFSQQSLGGELIAIALLMTAVALILYIFYPKLEFIIKAKYRLFGY